MNQVLEIIKNETLTYNQQVLQLAGYAGNSIEVFNIDEDTKIIRCRNNLYNV